MIIFLISLFSKKERKTLSLNKLVKNNSHLQELTEEEMRTIYG